MSESKILSLCATCSKENAKYRCGNCKKSWYCSQECQKADWKSHKPKCNYDAEKLISLVIVKGEEVWEQKVPRVETDPTNGWIPCKITEMIGVPVMVKRWASYTQIPSSEKGIFLMVDPITGLAGPEWQQGCGIIAFARKDRTDMTVQLFWDLYSYIFHLMDYYTDDGFNYNQFRQRKLNYESFRVYQEEEHRLQEEFRQLNPAL
ncbi:unnamed protein product [Brachionus calyciflorus]|uniref:MYND-type domain-containing protein n=1 Tax=Brachionus calyciflorus TaxID=104777 RepID=A0A813QKT6_9BILA|nr:unnamed protein product [Brachionus calyciflorus]